jgi:hypothetical protein
MPERKVIDPNDPAVQAKAKAAQKALENTKSPVPKPPLPPEDLVKLPGGLLRPDGTTITHAKIRELTGEHEEALAKAVQSGNMFHFMNVLLECGVAQIGELDDKDTKETLKDLLLGDRDELVLAIRSATYGKTMEFPDWVCPHCNTKSAVLIDLSPEGGDVIRKPLEDKRLVFSLDLPSGIKATAHLPTGKDQMAIFEDPDLTNPQRNSILIARCVETVTPPDGITLNVIAHPRIARGMKLADRHAIVDQLAERQPGPRYNEIKWQHTECGKEVTLALGIRDMFRELFLYL